MEELKLKKYLIKGFKEKIAQIMINSKLAILKPDR